MRTKRAACRPAIRRTPLVAAIACAFMAQGAAAVTITVTNANSSGAGSFYDAINQANAACNSAVDNAPTITFSGPFVISQSFPLPQFSCINPSGYFPRIDAANTPTATPNTSPTGFNANLPVTIDGSTNFSMYGCALAIQDFLGYGAQLTIKGLEIRNFNYGGFEAAVCGEVQLYGNRFVNNGRGVQAEAGSIIGSTGDFDRNVFTSMNTVLELTEEGTYSVVNNLIATTDGSTQSGSGPGIYSSPCCTTGGTGIISGNVMGAGIEIWGGTFEIKFNKIGVSADGSSAMGVSGTGIALYYSYGTNIHDNVISGSDGDAIYNTDSQTPVTIKNNKIGVDANGTAVLGNSGNGIYDSWSYGTRIEDNVISGNNEGGIYLRYGGDTEIVRNKIGVDANGGGSGFGNGWEGIYVGATSGSVDNVLIDDNTISGNGGAGISLDNSSFATITANKIGTNSIGMAAIPNDGSGIELYCGTDMDVQNNLISGNFSDGVRLNAILNSYFYKNSIGVAASGVPMTNDGDGIDASATTCGFVSDAATTARTVKASRVAKREARAKASAPAKVSRAKAATSFSLSGFYMTDGNTFEQNVIAYNANNGVSLEGSQNTFTGNTIRGNQEVGILIAGNGVGNDFGTNSGIFGNVFSNASLFYGMPLPNDPGDTDSLGYGNNGQNKPVITGAQHDTVLNQTTVNFTLDSQVGDFRIDLYSNTPTTSPGGEKWLASKTVTITSGPVADQFVLAGTGENYFSMLATRVGSPADTSEFADVVPATVVAFPSATITPSTVNFGDVVVGRSSSSSTVTIQSNGTADYIIRALRDGSCTGPAICTSGMFACSTSDCTEGASFVPGGACTITASFTPTAIGSQTKTLALCDNTAASPRTITFTGNGAPTPDVDVALAPNAWFFGEVLVGTQSPPKSFALTNFSGSTVYLSAPTVTGEFSITSGNCGSSLASGASCTTDVAFLPASRGLTGGNLEITASNTPSTPAALRSKVTTPTTTTVSARLQGSGVQQGDARMPSAIAFGTAVLNSASRTQIATISNGGNGPLAITRITITGPFTMTNACGPSLDPGASCNVTVGFTPSSLGNFSGALSVVTDAPGGSRAIPITASVIADARPVVRVSPVLAGFGDRVIGSTSPPQRFTVTNEGAEQAILGAPSFVQPEDPKAEFSISATTCGPNLAPQASCSIDVVLKPLGFGPRNGELRVPSNSADSPRTATLGGTGCRPHSARDRSGRDPCAP